MKLQHHLLSSLLAGGALTAATGSGLAMAGALLGGVLIDSDHVIDQLWSIRMGAPYMRRTPVVEVPSNSSRWKRLFEQYIRRRRLIRLPLFFHSYELMAVLIFLSIRNHTPLLVGLAAGYCLHLALDLFRHHSEFRSLLFYLLIYRLANGFQRERLIKPEHL